MLKNSLEVIMLKNYRNNSKNTAKYFPRILWIFTSSTQPQLKVLMFSTEDVEGNKLGN